MTSDPNTPPVNPVAAAVLVLAFAIVAIELVFSAGSSGLVGPPQAVGWRLSAIQRFAFSGELQDWMMENRRFPAEFLIRYVTYSFVHGSFTHAVIATVLLLALGKMVGDNFSQPATLVLFFVPATVGAFVYGALLEDSRPLLGAFPGVYGFIGGFTYLAWLKLVGTGGPRYRAFMLIGVLLGIQLLFGLLFGGSNEWVADLAAFLTGFGLAGVVAPGAMARLRRRLRRD